jgi:murein DD-endopeptidase MepM/ murein hydrolase activator NlpD
MPLGTLHWIPRHPGRGRPIILTRRGLQVTGLVAALALSMLLGAAFLFGRMVGRDSGPSRRTADQRAMRAELMQLEGRVENLKGRLEQIAEREERILVAGAGLNMDFSGLMESPGATSEDPTDRNLFRYIDDIELKILLAERLADAELQAYDSLANHFVEVSDRLAHTPSIWPVHGIFISDFGPRVDPFTGAVRYHKGIDIANNTGTPIYSPADGTVIFCGWTGGWGLNVVVRHTEELSTRYAHCSAVEVAVGQKVQRGDMIARVGSTGRSVGPHLHYEVLRNGVQIDPEGYIIRAGPDQSVF